MCIENSCPRIMAKHDGAVDPSLVKTCKRFKEVHQQYRLGMGSWTESSSEDEKETLPPKGKYLKLKKPPCKRLKEVHWQNPVGMGSWTESSSEDEKETLPPKGKYLKLKKPPCKRLKEVHWQNPVGMGSWTESSIEDEKEKLPPNGKSLKPSHLWSFIIDQEEELSERHVRKSTEATTKWVLANFNAWRQGSNEAFACDPNQQVPSDLLQITEDSERLCKWLTLYVAETRKQNGSRYPSKTIYSLLTGLLRHA